MSDDSIKLTPEGSEVFLNSISNPPEPDHNLKELRRNMEYNDTPKPEEVYQPKTNTIWEIAEFLYDLLDDIDTLDDACKDDDSTFRRLVYDIQQRRYQVAHTDGYNIIWYTHKEPKNSPQLPLWFGGTDGDSDPRRLE